jgi:23S rRNA pseudoU1915 N3-methylase RlmH
MTKEEMQNTLEQLLNKYIKELANALQEDLITVSEFKDAYSWRESTIQRATQTLLNKWGK